jgi:hypothetical protein
MSTVSTSAYITEQVSIYVGLFILTIGLFGGLFNIIIFLSLQTFRQSSCAFYLLVISIVNIGQLVSGLFSRIMISGFHIDWTTSSLFYCKLRYFIIETCELISCTCICLAILDQYFATCPYPRWQRWSNFKLAYYLTTIFTVIWILHGILYLVFFVHTKLSTGAIICTFANDIFSKYHAYGCLLTLTTILPISITMFLGSMVYNNIQQLAYRTVPLVRRESDKQLTVMVLVQIIINFITTLPSTIVFIISINVQTGDSLSAVIVQFAVTITVFIYYLNNAVCINYLYYLFNFIILVSILHIYLCIGTISSTIDPCIIKDLS